MFVDDERGFLKYIGKKDEISFVAPSSNTPELNVLEIDDIFDPSGPDIRKVLIVNQRFPIGVRDIQKIPVKDRNKSKASSKGASEFIYRINTSNAPVIEWSRSRLRMDNQLVPDSKWAEMTRLEEGTIVEKAPEFITWYERMASWLSGRYQRFAGNSRYFGPEASKWYAEGGKLYR